MRIVQKLTILFFLMMILQGCAVLLGGEDADDTQRGISLRFVESLRNESSLRGDSLQEAPVVRRDASSLQQPVAVYADAFRVYVVDRAITLLTTTAQAKSLQTSAARMVIFSRGDRKVSILDGTHTASDMVKLVAPTGITVDSVGMIFVADAQLGRVNKYDQTGNLLHSIGAMGDLAFPGGIAFDKAKNRLYVADSAARQVKIYDAFGARIGSLGEMSTKASENLHNPTALTVDGKGDIYVLDGQRKHIVTYASDGAFKASFSIAGTVPGAAVQPKGIAVDSDGHIYVTDTITNNILVFDANGMFLLTWGRTGGMFGEFLAPAGIFIDDHDRIYIADQMNGRIQVFQYVK